MRKYLLGVVTMVLSYALLSFTEIKNEKESGTQTEYYFLWNAATSSWQNVPASALEECEEIGNELCGMISTGIDENGQPSGTILETLYWN